jgi:two-component system, NarL family, response regulator DegU
VDKITVVVIDEQELFRAGVCQVLSQNPGFAVLECAPSDDTLRLIETTMPNIVLLSCQLTAHGGLELGKRIARCSPNTRVIMLSPDPDDEELFQVIKTSAVACVNRNASAGELVTTIRRVCNGEYPIHEIVMTRPAVARRVLRQFEEIHSVGGMAVEALSVPLTVRETQILGYVANGNTNKQIARALQISEQTIKNHISAILRKLNANDRAHAVVLAIRRGWISAEIETVIGRARGAAEDMEAVPA